MGRQNCRREANAAGIVGGSFAVTDTGLTDRDRADTCRDRALRQVALAHDALATILGLQVCMRAENPRPRPLQPEPAGYARPAAGFR